MLHVQPRPVTIYIWQMMAVSTSTEHLPPRPHSHPMPQPGTAPASSPVGTGLSSPSQDVGRTRHPQDTSWDALSPFSHTLLPPGPLQGPSSSPCFPSSSRRGRGQQAASPARLLVLGPPAIIPAGKPARRNHRRRQLDEGSSCCDPPDSTVRAQLADPEPILGTAALGPADGPALGPPSLEPGLCRVRTIGCG